MPHTSVIEWEIGSQLLVYRERRGALYTVCYSDETMFYSIGRICSPSHWGGRTMEAGTGSAAGRGRSTVTWFVFISRLARGSVQLNTSRSRSLITVQASLTTLSSWTAGGHMAARTEWRRATTVFSRQWIGYSRPPLSTSSTITLSCVTKSQTGCTVA